MSLLQFLSHVFEHNALELILRYTDLRESKDSRLAFEALKYLAALLCHKKFSIEFINMKGLQVSFSNCFSKLKVLLMCLLSSSFIASLIFLTVSWLENYK